MDIFTLSSTAHYPTHTPQPFPATMLAAVRPHHSHRPTVFSLKQSSDPPDDTPSSTSLRRPATHKPPKTPITSTDNSKLRKKNPLKDLLLTQNSTTPAPVTVPSLPLHTLTSKLRLSSKLSPPPPVIPEEIPSGDTDILEGSEISVENEDNGQLRNDFVEKGKIFVGNLPLWIKKNEVAEFFRQFGPIENVILIKGYNETDRNMGFGFVIYGGPTAEKAAMKAVEFDGVEFHGRVLTVKLDNGRRLKEKTEERIRWVEGKVDGKVHKSNWHQEREGSRMELRKVIESHPENWQAVVTAFEKIKKPSRREFGLMIKYYARRGDVHRARETFERMRTRGIEPSSHVFTSLVHAYAVGRDMDEALSCVRKMKDEGVETTLVTYSILVGGFAKVGKIDKVTEFWFKEAKQRFGTLNAIIYGNIIYAYCQSGDMERAEALVREMEEDGIDAPIGIYHTMMDGYTMIGNEHKCLTVFERLKECGFTPSVISYGCLINLYVKVGKVSKALEVSEMMKSGHIKHNMKTYSMLINGFIQLEDWSNAFAIYEDVIRDGLRPDVILYNNIIRAFCGMGNMDRALCTVEEMKRERHRPTSRTFMPIIHAFARRGDMRRALDVFDMMRMSGCIPTVHTFNALLVGLVEKRQMDKAVETLDEMILAGISPNEHTYTTIMHGYASVGDIGKAFEYFSKLKEEGLKLDVFTYEALLKACCKSGRMQSALAVTKEMSQQGISRNTFVYNILIDGWARRGDVWEAADLMQQMKTEGVQPDIHTYTSFINACCKAGDMTRATDAIEEMEALRIMPNVKTYTTLIKGWARASRPERALKCFEDMKQNGLKPDKAVYHCLMTSLLSRATMTEEYIHTGILSICAEMVESAITVDMGTAVHWSTCLHKIERFGGEITEALQKTFPPDWNSHKVLNTISDGNDNNYYELDNAVNDDTDSDVNSDTEDDFSFDDRS
ncbi:OLC1v1026411C2 [Oldenlandia corymbosa var. corymbosa]|uniref:OLC1v1026411C2 n=1 Tax=Oldenlandia corymbosa var. corymbosa TaxID=529605 RepID=A0AAV1C721_OLDCO|nr:OLC1v1026411C2 [Oldenlandia corymbosa var. corymbosa]